MCLKMSSTHSNLLPLCWLEWWSPSGLQIERMDSENAETRRNIFMQSYQSRELVRASTEYAASYRAVAFEKALTPVLLSFEPRSNTTHTTSPADRVRILSNPDDTKMTSGRYQEGQCCSTKQNKKRESRFLYQGDTIQDLRFPFPT